jgi:hypothetical protein
MGQNPQSSWPPQPSPTVPQYCPPPAGLQVALVQLVWAHTLAMPAVPHSLPVGHAPQSSDPPQPLPITPQYRPLERTQLVGFLQVPESVAAPQTLGMPPPPQVRPSVQSPQSSCRPQPSPILPQ